MAGRGGQVLSNALFFLPQGVSLFFLGLDFCSPSGGGLLGENYGHSGCGFGGEKGGRNGWMAGGGGSRCYCFGMSLGSAHGSVHDVIAMFIGAWLQYVFPQS